MEEKFAHNHKKLLPIMKRLEIDSEDVIDETGLGDEDVEEDLLAINDEKSINKRYYSQQICVKKGK